MFLNARSQCWFLWDWTLLLPDLVKYESYSKSLTWITTTNHFSFQAFMWHRNCFTASRCAGAEQHCVQHMYRALKAARLEAGHVLAQQPCCQSSHPITLGMTFKVGRRRRTKCPYLLCTSPAVEPMCCVCGWLCLCVLWLWPDLVWHKDSCHISNLSHATQRRC